MPPPLFYNIFSHPDRPRIIHGLSRSYSPPSPDEEFKRGEAPLSILPPLQTVRLENALNDYAWRGGLRG